MKNILILPLSGIGDALMFTPALTLLKEEYPHANIDALVMFGGVKNFYENLPQINNVHFFDFLNSNFFSATRFLLKFRKKYDVSINIYPSNRFQYNVVNFLIGSKKRAGINYKLNKLFNLHFLNNVRINEDLSLHNVEQNVKLIEKLTDNKYNNIPHLNFPLNEEDENFGKNFVDSVRFNENEKIIALHAGCSTLKNHINRRWAPEKFIELSRKLIARGNVRILLFGGPDENELKEKIACGVGSDKLKKVETNTLSQTAAVLKNCDLMISNDSGLMHIGAAMQRKIISLIGPTNKTFIAPWKTEHKIASINLDCSPCFYYSPKPLSCSRTDVQFKCLKELNVDSVLQLAVNYLR